MAIGNKGKIKIEYSGAIPRKLSPNNKDDMLYSPEGQYKYPGEIVKIPSGNITMNGVNYAVHGMDNLGNEQMMYPNQNYNFPGSSVVETPQLQKGGQPSQAKSEEMLHDGTAHGKPLSPAQKRYFGMLAHPNHAYGGPTNINLMKNTFSRKIGGMNNPNHTEESKLKHLKEYYSQVQSMAWGGHQKDYSNSHISVIPSMMAKEGGQPLRDPKDDPFEDKKNAFLGWLKNTSMDALHKEMIPHAIFYHTPDGIQSHAELYPDDTAGMNKKGGFHINPKHKGWCTPMTKSTCTGARRQFAINAKNHFKKQQDGGQTMPDQYMYEPGGNNTMQQGGFYNPDMAYEGGGDVHDKPGGSNVGIINPADATRVPRYIPDMQNLHKPEDVALYNRTKENILRHYNQAYLPTPYKDSDIWNAISDPQHDTSGVVPYIPSNRNEEKAYGGDGSVTNLHQPWDKLMNFGGENFWERTALMDTTPTRQSGGGMNAGQSQDWGFDPNNSNANMSSYSNAYNAAKNSPQNDLSNVGNFLAMSAKLGDQKFFQTGGNNYGYKPSDKELSPEEYARDYYTRRASMHHDPNFGTYGVNSGRGVSNLFPMNTGSRWTATIKEPGQYLSSINKNSNSNYDLNFSRHGRYGEIDPKQLDAPGSIDDNGHIKPYPSPRIEEQFSDFMPPGPRAEDYNAPMNIPQGFSNRLLGSTYRYGGGYYAQDGTAMNSNTDIYGNDINSGISPVNLSNQQMGDIIGPAGRAPGGYNHALDEVPGQTINLKRNTQVNPEDAVNWGIAGMNAFTSLLGQRDILAREQQLKNRTHADMVFSSTPQNMRSRGDYDTNSGMFRPDQDVPTQFMGNPGMRKMGGEPCYNCGGSFEDGGEMYLSDDEIANIRANGGEVTYLD